MPNITRRNLTLAAALVPFQTIRGTAANKAITIRAHDRFRQSRYERRPHVEQRSEGPSGRTLRHLRRSDRACQSYHTGAGRKGLQELPRSFGQ